MYVTKKSLKRKTSGSRKSSLSVSSLQACFKECNINIFNDFSACLHPRVLLDPRALLHPSVIRCAVAISLMSFSSSDFSSDDDAAPVEAPIERMVIGIFKKYKKIKYLFYKN